MYICTMLIVLQDMMRDKIETNLPVSMQPLRDKIETNLPVSMQPMRVKACSFFLSGGKMAYTLLRYLYITRNRVVGLT